MGAAESHHQGACHATAPHGPITHRQQRCGSNFREKTRRSDSRRLPSVSLWLLARLKDSRLLLNLLLSALKPYIERLCFQPSTSVHFEYLLFKETSTASSERSANPDPTKVSVREARKDTRVLQFWDQGDCSERDAGWPHWLKDRVVEKEKWVTSCAHRFTKAVLFWPLLSEPYPARCLYLTNFRARTLVA